MNNACIKFNLYICITIASFQIYTLHKMHKEYPQTYTLLCIKVNVHVSFDCSIRVYQSICTWCGEYFPEW